MKIKGVLGIIMLFMTQNSCNSKHRIEKYDLNPIIEKRLASLNKTDTLIKLNLCGAIPFKWDSIVVLPPYAHEGMLEKLSLININEVAEQFPYSTANRFPLLTIDERVCMLLFVEENRIVNYSGVMRASFHFRDLVKENDLIKSIAREDFCNKLYVVKRSDTLISPSIYRMVLSP